MIKGYRSTPLDQPISRLFRLVLLGLAGLILCGAAGTLQAQAEPFRILIIHSYHPSFSWTDRVMQGMQAEFDQSGLVVDISVEYLDAKRHPPEEVVAAFDELLAAKYEAYSIDVILVSDNDALDFILRYGDRLFPGMPVVFGGINNFDDDLLAGHPLITGVAEDFDLEANLQMIQRLQPNLRTVAVVSDATSAGQLNLRRMQAVMPAFQDRLHFVELTNLAADELVAALQALPPDSAVFYMSFLRDRAGQVFSIEQSSRLVAENAPAPVYTAWDFMLGYGIVGGVVVNGEKQGRAAAEMAIKILQGEPVEQLPVQRQSPNTPMFDYVPLTRWGINPASLPAGSLIINQPVSVYQRYYRLVWGGIGFILFQSLIIAVLVTTRLDRQRAEAALRESEERYRQLVEFSPFAIMVQSQGRVIFVNPATLTLMGAQSPEQLLGQPVLNFIHPDERAAKQALLEQMQVGGVKPVTGPQGLLEERLLRLDGSVVTVEAAALPLVYQGQPALQVILQDTSARKQAEAEKEKLQGQLLQAQKMEAVGQLAGGIAHDFNNILTAVIGHAGLALAALPSEHPAREDIQGVQKSAERAARLVRQLLTFARRQIGRPQLVNIDALVADIGPMLRRLIGENIELVILPGAGSNQVRVDPHQFEQVLVNLVVNARDAMPAGGELTLATASILSGTCSQVKLTVSDTGVGIEPGIRERIFEPFFTTKEVGQGSGLGLATCFGIIKAHDGSIEVDSQPGRGSRFTIYLPVATGAKSEPAAVDENGSSPGGGTETILLVEDEPAVRILARRILAEQGYTVLEAGNGAECLRLAETRGQTKVDLLVTDMVMPLLGGWELAKKLETRWPGLKVLFISGYTDHKGFQPDRLGPGQGYLPKPFTAADLIGRVRRLLDQA